MTANQLYKASVTEYKFELNNSKPLKRQPPLRETLWRSPEYGHYDRIPSYQYR